MRCERRPLTVSESEHFAVTFIPASRKSIRKCSSGRRPCAGHSQSNEQGVIELMQLGCRQFADIVSQSRFLKTHRSVALDCAFVLEALSGAHSDLRR